MFEALDALLADEVAGKALPSISYCVFDRNGVLTERHVGGRCAALSPRSMFRIGSVSKTLAAVLAMRLVEAGRLDLDADITKYLPGFAPEGDRSGGPVTLRKLLSHRSGMTREAGQGGYLDDGNPPLAATVAGLGRSRLKAPGDGSSFFYSNAGYAVIGRVIELITSRSYADHLQAELLRPQGLGDTSIVLTRAVRDRLAPAVMWTEQGDAPAVVFDLGSAPAGNIAATLGDVARWGQALLRPGALLRPETLDLMWTPAGADPRRGYGLGFAADRLDEHRSVGHGGAAYGYSTAFRLLPEAGLGAIVVSTLDFTGALAGRIAEVALRVALGTGAVASPYWSPPGATRASALAGTYSTASGKTIELRADGARLTLVHRGVPLEFGSGQDGRLVAGGRLADDWRPGAGELIVIGQTLRWSGETWQRGAARQAVRPQVQAHLGDYAPAFMPTRLFLDGPDLVCRIENLSPHVCEPLGGQRFLMRGPMYEREVLELCPADADGNLSIRVGEMHLAALK